MNTFTHQPAPPQPAAWMPTAPPPRRKTSGGRIAGILALIFCLVPALLLVVAIAVGSFAGSAAENSIRERADHAAQSVGPVTLAGEQDLGGNLLCLDSCREIHRTYRLDRPAPLSEVRRSLGGWYAKESSLGPIGKAWCDRSHGGGCPEVALYQAPPRDYRTVATLEVCPDDARAVASNTADLPDRDVKICGLSVDLT